MSGLSLRSEDFDCIFIIHLGLLWNNPAQILVLSACIVTAALSFSWCFPWRFSPAICPPPLLPLLPALPPSSTPETIPAIAPTSTPVIAYQPIFEPAPCAFPVPSGYNPECGYLLVPENRTRADSPLVRLHVAIFRNRAGLPVPDPVVHLAGGPGSSSLGVAGYMFSQGLDAILDQRDFILFDQRGTGYSQPRLDCPERASVTGILLERGLLPRELTRSSWMPSVSAATGW